MEKLPAHWCAKHDVNGVTSREYFERADGVYVWPSNDYQHSNPLDPNCRLWEVFPEVDGLAWSYVQRGARGRLSTFNSPRRFKTAMNAMRAADKAFPYGHRTSLSR